MLRFPEGTAVKPSDVVWPSGIDHAGYHGLIPTGGEGDSTTPTAAPALESILLAAVATAHMSSNPNQWQSIPGS